MEVLFASGEVAVEHALGDAGFGGHRPTGGGEQRGCRVSLSGDPNALPDLATS
jgi:hypothetical protein